MGLEANVITDLLQQPAKDKFSLSIPEAAAYLPDLALTVQIADWDGNVAFRQDRITEMREQLETLSGKQREKLEDKIVKWEGLINSTQDKADEATAELAVLSDQISGLQDAISAQQAICDGAPVSTGAGVFYLHADHLGRPQFATDTDGAIVWDMGEGVTPFGEGVNLAGAFAQRLMFPGQYADVETGEEITLSHNWHRTYDPTLGRYLQSDPIGLAGGLNRYAYVGGNPVGWIDPDGEAGLLGAAVFGVFELGRQLWKNGGNVKCVKWTQVGLAAAGGAFGGAAIGARAFQFGKYSKKWSNVSRRYRRHMKKNGNTPDGPWDAHHGIFRRNGNTGPSWSNHPLNLKPVPRGVHQRIHGVHPDLPQFGPIGRWWHGTPAWAKIAQSSPAAGAVADVIDKDCGC